LFFSKFLRQGKAIASFVPSSPWLARAVVEGIDFQRCRCIVELGAGTGPITAELLPRLGATCRALIIERDVDFCVRLRQRFPDADIIQADAADLEQILQERGVEQVDHFLCGLPLPSFLPPLRDRVLNAVRNHLVHDGTFRQLTHMPYVYYRLYRRYFREVCFHFVFRNLPPAGFYTCTGCQSSGEW
jgi:phosphatidylethanolamine/phosphatidyl-N-methylethanolamine N-methyltransferase